MSSGQLSQRNKDKKRRRDYKSIPITKEYHQKIVGYARQENIYIIQALETIIDKFFESL
jgi:hypothetical protein